MICIYVGVLNMLIVCVCLTQSLSGSKGSSLLHSIDSTVTPGGSRLLAVRTLTISQQMDRSLSLLAYSRVLPPL